MQGQFLNILSYSHPNMYTDVIDPKIYVQDYIAFQYFRKLFEFIGLCVMVYKCSYNII